MEEASASDTSGIEPTLGITQQTTERSISSPLIHNPSLRSPVIVSQSTPHRYRSSLTIAPTSIVNDQADVTSTSIATTPSNSSPYTAIYSPSASSVSSFDCNIQSTSDTLTQQLSLLSVNQSNNQPNHQYHDSTLFVGQLSALVSTGQLRQLFGSFGPIISIDIKRDKRTKATLGYAFVVLSTRDLALRAKAALTGRLLHQRPIRIGFAHQNSTLFVGNLADSVTVHELCAAFRPFGEVIDDLCSIKFNKLSPSSAIRSPYGLVRFAKRDDAERAKQAMHGKPLGGRSIRVAWGDSSVNKTSVQISVQLSPQFPPAFPTQESITEACRRFGRVISVAMPHHINASGQLVAVVQFDESPTGEQNAAAAVHNLNGRLIDNFYVSVTYGRRTPNNRFTSINPQIPAHPAVSGGSVSSIGSIQTNNFYAQSYALYQPMYFPTFDPSHVPYLAHFGAPNQPVFNPSALYVPHLQPMYYPVTHALPDEAKHDSSHPSQPQPPER